MRRLVLLPLLCTLASVTLASAAPLDMSAPKPWSDSGATAQVLRAGGHPIAVVMKIPAAAIDTPPAMRSEAVLPLSGAGLIRSANLQYHPHGHEPEHVYDVPHYDVHFYTIAEPVRMGIVPGARAGKVTPPAAMLPPGTVVAPGYVPTMGYHVIAKSAPEFAGKPFAITPILGFWNGDVNFFEVMFSRAWALQHRTASGAMLAPAAVKTHGWYPTRYRAAYDAKSGGYTVAVTDFVRR